MEHKRGKAPIERGLGMSLNIIVVIKAVPETSDVRWDEKKGTMIREGINQVINPYDLHALEEGIRLKEKYKGKVIVLSMGPGSVKEVLRETLALGADDAILLSDPDFAGSDTLVTSFILSSAIRQLRDADLILCGKQAVDGDTAQVGPEIAQNLDIPYVTFVRKIDELKGRKIIVERLMENGYQILEMPLPGLLTVVKEINEPRFPRLSGKFKAKNIDIKVWGANALKGKNTAYGRSGSPTQVIRIFTPQARKTGEIISGSVKEEVRTLIARLREKKVIQCPSE
jgi:electron transfer flavoprotein beta subunit